MNWTKDMDEWLRENCPNYSYPKLKTLFYEKFHTNINVNTLHWHCQEKLGIKKPKGFQSGNVPYNTHDDGDEVVRKGTVMRKVNGSWIAKINFLYPEYDHKTQQVIYLDGNSTNVTKENTLIVSKKIHARLAQNGWFHDKEELFCGIKYAELLYAINDLKEGLKAT